MMRRQRGELRVESRSRCQSCLGGSNVPYFDCLEVLLWLGGVAATLRSALDYFIFCCSDGSLGETRWRKRERERSEERDV